MQPTSRTLAMRQQARPTIARERFTAVSKVRLDTIALAQTPRERCGPVHRPRRSALDLGVVLRRFAALEHAVIADDADAAVTLGVARPEGVGGGVIAPRREQQRLARVGDALE